MDQERHMYVASSLDLSRKGRNPTHTGMLMDGRSSRTEPRPFLGHEARDIARTKSTFAIMADVDSIASAVVFGHLLVPRDSICLHSSESGKMDALS